MRKTYRRQNQFVRDLVSASFGLSRAKTGVNPRHGYTPIHLRFCSFLLRLVIVDVYKENILLILLVWSLHDLILGRKRMERHDEDYLSSFYPLQQST